MMRIGAGIATGVAVVIGFVQAQDTQPPSTPQNLDTVEVSAVAVTIAWSPSEDNVGVEKYVIKNKTFNYGNTSDTTFTFDFLWPENTLELTVIAVDSAGNESEPSAVLTVTTLPDTLVPSIPENCTALDTAACMVSLRWDRAHDDAGVTGYMVIVGETDSFEVQDTFFTVRQLTPETHYSFAVKSIDVVNKHSAVSNTVEVTTLSEEKRVLMVAKVDERIGPEKLTDGDIAMYDRLARHNHVVIPVPFEYPSDVEKVATEEYDFIIISATVLSSSVADAFTETTVPVMVSEVFVLDEMDMIDTGSALHQGEIGSHSTDITLLSTTHPITQGLPAEISLCDTIEEIRWGAPNENAINLASLREDSTHSVLYCYEKDAEMFHGTVAAARRVCFGIGLNTAAYFTDQAWVLFDRVVGWAMGDVSLNAGNQGAAPNVCSAALQCVNTGKWMVVVVPDMGTFDFRLLSLAGRQLYVGRCDGGAKREIDLRMLPSGSYYLDVRSRVFSWTFPFTVR
jgi:hypothetical protein